MKAQKAQISIFLIVGLVALLGTIITIAVFTDFLEYKPPEQQVSSELESELRPLTVAIEQCQERILSEQARKLLAQGGYLEPEQQGIISMPYAQGTGVEVASNQVLPYWRHLSDGREQTQRPPLTGAGTETIASQLGQAVDKELASCVPWDDFREYTIERGEPTTLVTFSTDTTTINTAWDVDVETSLGTRSYEQFLAESNTPVRRLYSVADEVVELMRSTRLIENRVMDWLMLYAGITELPPLDGSLDFASSIEIHDLQQATPVLQQVITRALTRIQLYGSQDAELQFSDVQAINLLQTNSLIPATPHTNTQTRFRTYTPSTTTPYFAVNGNRAAAIPEIHTFSGLGFVGLSLMVDETYYYDVRFPAVLEISIGDYTLNVAYQANIKENSPQDADELIEEAEQDALCESPGGVKATITTNSPDIPAAAVYRCGTTTCGVGTVTDGELQTQLPACASGELEVHAQGFFSESIGITSVADADPKTFDIDLYEPQTMDVNLLGRDVQFNAEGDIELGENAFQLDADVFFVRQGHPYFGVVDEDFQVTLVPGTYDVYAINVDEYPADEPFIIEEVTRSEQGEEYTLEEVQLQSLPTAYLELSGDRAVTIEAGTSEIQLITASLNPADIQEHEDLELLGALFELGANLDPEHAFITR